MKSCPSCNKLLVVPICYGKPGGDLLDAADAGLCVLGGCIIEEKSPTWYCKACGFKWMDDQSEVQNSSATLKEVRRIVEANRYPIFTGMVLAGLGNSDIRGVPASTALTDFSRLKKLLNLDSGYPQETFERVAKSCRSNPKLRDALMKSLGHGLAIYILKRGQEDWQRPLYELLFSAAVLVIDQSPLTREKPKEEEIRRFERLLRDWQFDIE